MNAIKALTQLLTFEQEFVSLVFITVYTKFLNHGSRRNCVHVRL